MSAQQYGHAGQHHGRGTPDCPVELHHHHDERCASPLDERRQRAREAGWDATVGWSHESTARAIESAIETATRVKLTPEVIIAYGKVLGTGGARWKVSGTSEKALIAALEAAGFEVEQ